MRAALLLVLIMVLAAAPARAQDASDIVFGQRTAIPPATCQPGDRPETDLQGRVPPMDLVNGRAVQGYSCNLTVVGRFPSTMYASLDGLGDCAYFGREAGAGGVQVLDVSDPALPLPTDTLHTPAMIDPWESLRVHGKRKLLIAGNANNGFLDIYDIAGDCTRPRLLSSTDFSPAMGHEGWFSPDGMTFFMSRTGTPGTPTVFPIDVSDPAAPKLLASWTFASQTHGGATTEDGKRSYICQQDTPPVDALLVVDSSDLAKPQLLREEPLGDNQWCQGAHRVTYGGRPHLIQFGERSGAPDCTRASDNWATFAYPRIYDLADERKPKLVSEAMLASALPENCETVKDDLVAVNGFGYSVHHCSPDRLYDPTILACSWFSAGLRVLDIRDPARPRELAYFNAGTPVPFGSGSRVVVRSDRREIWVGHDTTGFYVLGFADGVWPFAGSAPCPEYDDYWFATYNETSKCATASYAGLGKPAPGGAGPAPAPAAGKLAARLSLRAARLARGRVRIRGTLSPAVACRGTVRLTITSRGRTLRRRAALDRRCRFAATVRARGRVRVTARFAGNAKLRPATRRAGL